MEVDTIIKMISSDGKVVEISKKAASKSKLLKGIFEDFPDNTDVTLNNVKGDILEKVKEYLVHYENIEPEEIELPLKNINFKQCVPEWDYNYLGENIDLIFGLLDASNYMDIKPLLELTSAKLGSKIKGMTSEKINQDFEIPPLTNEEKNDMINDRKYLEENL